MELGISYFLWNYKQLFHLTPLHYAVKNGYIEIVKILISNPSISIDAITIPTFLLIQFELIIHFYTVSSTFS